MGESTVGTDAVHQFNGDLGVAPGSADAIRKRFTHAPWLVDLLIDEELNAAFRNFEERALGRKRSLRKWGTIWLIGAGVGLLAAAVELLVRALGGGEHEWVAMGGGIAAVVAAVSGIGAVCLVSFKKVRKHWLENRFAAERLRQWHFQTLLDADLVALAAHDAAAFKTKRARRFAEFVGGEIAQISGTMQTWSSDPQKDEEFSHDVGTGRHRVVDDAVWEAYTWLRLQHQQRHWGAKLAPDDRLMSVESFIRAAGQTCFQLAVLALAGQVVLFVTHLISGPLGITSRWPEHAAVVATGASLLLVILSVVFRALDEGLGIGREAEHYRNMSLVYVGITSRARDAADDRSRRQIMHDVELWAMTELKDFLMIHAGARFLL